MGRNPHLGEKLIRSIDMPRRKCIDSDPLRSEFTGHTAAHLQHSGFARIVRNPGVVLKSP